MEAGDVIRQFSEEIFHRVSVYDFHSNTSISTKSLQKITAISKSLCVGEHIYVPYFTGQSKLYLTNQISGALFKYGNVICH